MADPPLTRAEENEHTMFMSLETFRLKREKRQEEFNAEIEQMKLDFKKSTKILERCRANTFMNQLRVRL